MPRKRKLVDLGDRCRFCLARDANMIALFDSKKQIGELLPDLQKCTGIQISSKANYPKNVCHVCLYKLEMWSEFKFQFLKTNKTLTNHFKLFEPIEDVNDVECVLISEDAKRKRVKINENSFQQYSLKLQKTPVIPLTDIKTIVVKASEEKKTSKTAKKAVEEAVNSEKLQVEEINNISASQYSLSDSPSRGSRRSGRPRKLEREASTKRWVERKNALIVATGKQPYESESDSDSQMSPVQKARVGLNMKRRLDRELKCLETNLSEKYRVKQEDVVGEERKMRPRRAKANVEEPSVTSINISSIKTRKSNTLKEKPKLEVKEKSNQVIKVETKDNDIKKEELSKDFTSIPDGMEIDEPKKEIKQRLKRSQKEKEKVEIVENERMEEEEEEMGVTMPDNIETEEERYNATEEKEKNNEASKVNMPESDEESKLNHEVADQEMLELLNNNINILEKENSSFAPQLVTSEITIGNATYLVTTTLDMPNPTSLNNDVSLKTNGINIDTASQDGKKIDIMNAVQLQKVEGEKEGDQSLVKRNSGADIQKCLKIEIEGMEVEALQRVQLDLAYFINEDIRKRLIEEAEGHRKTAPKPSKFKDSYENLNFQLRDIIENVLRNTYTADKLSAASKKVPTLLIQAAKASPMFQPKVKVAQLDINKARQNLETYKLNENEETKEKQRVAGPLSRTLGKRRPILPKKYEDFSVNFRPMDDEVEEKKPGGRLTPNKGLPLVPTKPNHTGLLELINAEKNSGRSTPTSLSFKPKDPVVCEDVKEDIKIVETPAKKNPVVSEWSSNGKLSSTPAVSKPIPIAASTPSVVTTLEKVMSSVQVKPAATTPSVPTTPVNQVTKFITKPTIVATDKLTPVISLPSTKIICANVSTKRPSDDVKMLTTPKRERHVCGMCGKELSMQEAYVHMEQHRAEINSTDKPSRPPVSISTNNGNASNSLSTSNVSVGSNNTSGNSAQKPKPKLMRCKRCQAIVEAKQVKTHVCNSVKYNCDMCECTFGAQHLLIEHKQTHTQSKSKPKTMLIVPTTPSSSTLLSTTSLSAARTIKPNQVKSNPVKDKTRALISVAGNNEHKKSEKDAEKKSDPKMEKSEQKVPESEVHSVDDMLEDDTSRGVACFVCDRVFSNEQQMKDHLQMHCEEVSESIEKDNFTCAFCADKFPNEEQLEEHVNVHLNEDGDEKISMMIDAQLEARRDRQRKPFKCDQCGENFPTASLLEMHAAIHDEEEEEAAAAVAAQAHDDVDNLENPDELAGDHVCDVCDEIFDTQTELRTHREAHNGNSHICILCEMPFVSIEELQEHVSTHL